MARRRFYMPAFEPVSSGETLYESTLYESLRRKLASFRTKTGNEEKKPLAG
jgi:hypothetical protein